MKKSDTKIEKVKKEPKPKKELSNKKGRSVITGSTDTITTNELMNTPTVTKTGIVDLNYITPTIHELPDNKKNISDLTLLELSFLMNYFSEEIRRYGGNYNDSSYAIPHRRAVEKFERIKKEIENKINDIEGW